MLVRDAHRGGKNYKEKQRSDFYEIGLVAACRYKGEDCDQQGHIMDVWSPSNVKCLNLSGSNKYSFYNML